MDGSLAIHPEEIVAFAEPAGLGLDDRHDRADVMALALDVQEFVVGAVRGRGQRLPIAGVKVRRVRGQRRDFVANRRGK